VDDNQAEKDIMDADVEEHRDLPTLLDKLRARRDRYNPDGETPNVDMHEYTERVIAGIENHRRQERRQDQIRRQKRKRQTAARKRSRR